MMMKVILDDDDDDEEEEEDDDNDDDDEVKLIDDYDVGLWLRMRMTGYRWDLSAKQ